MLYMYPYTEMSFFVEMLSTCLEETFFPLFLFVNVKRGGGGTFFRKAQCVAQKFDWRRLEFGGNNSFSILILILLDFVG